MGFFSSSGTETLVEEQILNSWNNFIPTGAGRGEKFYEAVRQFLDAVEIPRVLVEEKDVATISTERRRQKDIHYKCLHIRGDTGSSIAGYDVYVAAFDYGKHLIVARYVVGKKAKELSLFEREELGAYLNLVQSCVLRATEQIMVELKQDISKLNRESKGSYIFSQEL